MRDKVEYPLIVAPIEDAKFILEANAFPYARLKAKETGKPYAVFTIIYVANSGAGKEVAQ